MVPPYLWGISEPHIVSALRRKRAEIGGYIRDLERKIKRQRAVGLLRADEIADLLHQPVEVDRFGVELVASRRERALAIARHRVRVKFFPLDPGPTFQQLANAPKFLGQGLELLLPQQTQVESARLTIG